MDPGNIISAFGFWMTEKWRSKKTTTKSTVSNVFVLRTHVLNDYVHRQFLKMQQQLGAENVFLLFDETRTACPLPAIHWTQPGGAVVGPAVITINESDCGKINHLHHVGPHAGSMYRVEAQVYACYAAIRQPYDYMWLIEYDVYCNDFEKIVQESNCIKADLLTKGLKNRGLLTMHNEPGWYWWQSLVGAIAQTPMELRRGCFFPVNRFSPRFLAVLAQNLSKSSGYCEVYFPTLCLTSGLEVKPFPSWLFGIFRYQPNIAAKKIKGLWQKDYRLYHPVKQL